MKGWDEYGTILTRQNATPGRNFVDLRPLRAPVMAATHPAGMHFYVTPDRNGLCSAAYVCKSYKCRADYSTVDHLFTQLYGGLNYLLYIEEYAGLWLVRFANIDENTEEYERRYADPLPVQDILDGVNYPIANRLAPPKLGDTKYPHRCPHCSGPAYVGFNSVDCLKRCR